MPAEGKGLALLVLQLRGSQEAMGEQHGRLTREAGGYQQAIEFYPRLPMRFLEASTSREPLKRLIGAGIEGMLHILELARPKEYRARSRSFMQALGRPTSDARFYQIMDVFQNMVGLAGRFRAGPFARELANGIAPACSSLCVWGAASADGLLRHARNFDLPGIGIWDRGPSVVFCRPDEGLRYGFVSTRGADAPAVTAFNEAGLTLSTHTRFHRDVSIVGRSVVDLGHDMVRRAETIADAIAIARERRVASTWGFAVSSARERRAVVIEINAADVRVVDHRGDFLTCANRYRDPDMARGELALTTCWASHSDTREKRLAQIVDSGRARGGLTVLDLQNALGDHLDPDGPGELRGGGGIVSQAITVQSVVVEPERQCVHVSVGAAPTGWGPYVAVPWRWEGEVSAHELATPTAPRGGPLAPTARAAHAHFVEAVRIESVSHDWERALAEIDEAVALSPRDPSYRFLAGVLRLRVDRPQPALDHFEHGLQTETGEFRRGQLLLWAARAADACGKSDRARDLRDELLATRHELLAPHRQSARDELDRPYSRSAKPLPNLILADAM